MTETKLAKKAAKKVAHKAAKKVAKKAAKKTAKGPGNDARRAYEHLQRLRILHEQISGEPVAQLNVLSQFAQAAFTQSQAKDAAELLRAGEHLAFGSLAMQTGSHDVSEELKVEMRHEFQHLLERAGEHWEEQEPEPPRELKAIYRFMLAEAKAAWKSGAFHRALEFARGAGALAHTHVESLRLGPGASSGDSLLSAGKR